MEGAFKRRSELEREEALSMEILQSDCSTLRDLLLCLFSVPIEVLMAWTESDAWI